MIYGSRWLSEMQILKAKNRRVQKTRVLAICSGLRIQFAAALATLASMVDASPDMVIKPLNIQIHQQPAYYCNLTLVDGKPLFWDIQTWLEKEEYLEGASKSDKRTLQELSKCYLYKDGILYKWTWNQAHLRCVTEEEA
ncbi:uncharacterized protein LOC119370999 [Jatropha curcas]|uniref:uncharacterized protein LOC119370999 n=1 Tax=Jatropha curcas TaxID=180498 RepID=UPI0018930D87|nr:uncharacterized protein LOC119370999 [Jatropha curcas]